MPRTLSLKTIHARIAALEAKAKEIENRDKPGVRQVVFLIKKYKLSLADIEGALPGKRAKSGRRPSKLRGKKAPVKYRDKKGNKWSGRGLAPNWIKLAEKAGHKRDEFLVKR